MLYFKRTENPPAWSVRRNRVSQVV